MSPAMAEAMRAVTAGAIYSAHYVVKQRARRFRGDTLRMIGIDPRLPFAEPRELLAIGAALLEREERRPPSGLIQIAPVGLTNARAVVLLGRWERRFGARMREAA